VRRSYASVIATVADAAGLTEAEVRAAIDKCVRLGIVRPLKDGKYQTTIPVVIADPSSP